jgi:hypothetical protein
MLVNPNPNQNPNFERRVDEICEGLHSASNSFYHTHRPKVQVPLLLLVSWFLD